MIGYKKHPIDEFENFASMAQSPSEMDFFLRHTLKINEQYVEVREFIVYHKGDLGVFLSKLQAESPYSLEILNPNIPSFKLSKRDEVGKKIIKGVIVVLKSTTDYLYRVISVSHGDFWSYAVKPFLRRKYPHFSVIYFKQDELTQALLNFEKRLIRQYFDKAHISVIEVTKKTEHTSIQNQRPKFISTERSWTNLSLSEVFSDLKEGGFWYTSLKFKITNFSALKGTGGRKITGKISKFGHFSCSGNYHEIRTYLIEPLELLAADRMQLLEGRGIVERNYQPGPPLEISYDDTVFDIPSKVRQFGEILNKYQDASIVVYHGNPYFHASIADQHDGSSFEIWILSQNRILISPQARSSAQALSRVITYIFDRYKEGKVSEYVPRAD